MSLKKISAFSLKTLVLSVAMLIVMVTVSGFAVPTETTQTASQNSGTIFLRLFIVNLANALLINLVVTQTRWRGWPLMLGLSFAFYGVQTIIGQIEAIVFLTPLGELWGAGSIPVLTMPPNFILGQFIVGAALAAIGVPLSVLFFRKRKRGDQPMLNTLIPKMGTEQWLIKIGLIIVLYVALYFGFGYFVAWKNPAVQAFYQGTDPGSFLAQMRNVATETPTLIPFQALRALLWIVFALPIIRMLRKNGLWGALLTGLFISLPMNIPHIVPNPFMPPDVRTVHFIETVPSTFIFGMLLFWLLHRPHRSVKELFSVPFTRRKRRHRVSVEKVEDVQTTP
ncbi:MAG: hypothetical protein KGY46_10925 [Anaerolineales bacterium]|nr:hypothetical protein [Anaerolineales bacterium]